MGLESRPRTKVVTVNNSADQSKVWLKVNIRACGTRFNYEFIAR